MSSEIERKYLLGELPEWLAGRPGWPILQGYLSNGEGAEIRLRRDGEQTLMTVKTGAGEVREEVEVEIAPALFDSLWGLTEGRRVEKTRRREPLGNGLTAEVDSFAGELDGLKVVEVEFGSTAESAAFEPPMWFGVEVTEDSRYANRNLASEGAPTEPPAAAPSEERAPRSRGFVIKHKEEVGTGLLRAARGRAEKAIEALDGAGENPDEAVHSARKDLKKLRSLLRLTRHSLGEDLYRAENERYRGAGRELSGSRDAAVKVETLAALEAHFRRRLPSASAGGWKRILEVESDDAAGSLHADSEQIAAARSAIAAGAAAIDDWPLRGDSWKLIGPGLRHGYGRGRETLELVADDPGDPELVHEWRKRSKDVWYQLRLIRKAWPGLLDATVEQAHELTELLGDHHDLTVLGEDLAAREEIGSREQLAGLIERRQDELLEQAIELGRRLYAEKPKRYERRLRAYWSAWR